MISFLKSVIHFCSKKAWRIFCSPYYFVRGFFQGIGDAHDLNTGQYVEEPWPEASSLIDYVSTRTGRVIFVKDTNPDGPSTNGPNAKF